MAPFRGMIDPILQRALEMRERFRGATESHRRADVVAAALAAGAGVAGHADFEGHAVSRLQL